MTTKQEISRVALYTRVSRQEQTKGHSLDTQRDLLTQWASEEGWQVVEHYQDAGASGTSTTKRPAFLRMIQDASDKRFDAVLVLRFDRFARSMRDATTYREHLSNVGIALLSFSERVEEGPSGFLSRGMHELLAEYYAVELSRKVRDGWKKRAEKGLWPGSVIPYGYRRESKEQPLKIEPSEAEAVRLLFQWYAEGTSAIEKIGQKLAARGLMARRGAQFNRPALRYMLSNPVYTGDLVFKGEVVARDTHEAIIDRPLFAKVQSMLDRSAVVRRPRADYMLSGVAICSDCGTRLQGHTQTKAEDKVYRYYRCANRDCPAKVVARAYEVDQDISQVVEQLELPEEWQRYIEHYAEERRPDVAGEKERLKRRLAQVRRMLVDDLLPYDEGRAEVRTIENQIEALDAEIAPPQTILAAEHLNEMQGLWGNMTDAERQAWIREILETVEVDVTRSRVVSIVPRPAYAPLFRVVGDSDGIVVASARRLRSSNANVYRLRLAPRENEGRAWRKWPASAVIPRGPRARRAQTPALASA